MDWTVDWTVGWTRPQDWTRAPLKYDDIIHVADMRPCFVLPLVYPQKQATSDYQDSVVEIVFAMRVCNSFCLTVCLCSDT